MILHALNAGLEAKKKKTERERDRRILRILHALKVGLETGKIERERDGRILMTLCAVNIWSYVPLKSCVPNI